MRTFSMLNLKIDNIQKFTQSKIFLFLFLLLLLISSYSFIHSMLPIYLVCFFVILINLKKFELKKKNLIGYLLLIIFIGIFIINSDDFIFSLRTIRYYFGFLLFYIFFNLINIKNVNYKYLTIFLIYWVIIESLLINTIIDPSLIQPDFRDTIFLGFYYRPWSFNSNPTATAGILIFIYYFVENSLKINLGIKNLFLLCIAILLLFSSTGFALLGLFLFLKFIIDDKSKILNFFILGLFTIILLKISNLYPANYYSVTEKYFNFEKISPKYFFIAYDYKLEQIIEFLNKSKNIPFINIILGSSIYDIGNSCNNIYITPQDICFKLSNSGIGGDFGLIVILEQIGFLGLITLILLFIFLKNNNLKLVKLYLLIIVSFIHYPVIFMPLGQLFTGYILSNNFNNEKKI